MSTDHVEDDAVSQARAAVADSPDNPSCWKRLAEVLEAAQDGEGCVAALKRLVALSPGSAPAHERLSGQLVALGHVDEALGHLRQAVQIEPDRMKPWKRLGRLLDQVGKTDESEAIWLRVIELEPSDAEGNKRLADIRYRDGKVEEAAAHRGAALAEMAKRTKTQKSGRIAPASDVAREICAQLQVMADDDRPIVAGPWQSEIGHELLYWIPFLRWATREFGLDPSRVHVVSRGGAGSWYEGISAEGNYTDIFGRFTPEDFAARADDRYRATGMRKAARAHPDDQAMLEHLGLPSDAHLLHPEMMFQMFRPYWKGIGSFDLFLRSTAFEPMQPPQHPIVASLPPSFVAVKFYARESLPLSPDNVAFVRRLTLELANAGPVVFMDTDVKADEHEDFLPPEHPNVISIRQWLSAGDNLLVQSAVASRASRMYGTYGGMAYLPLYYRVPMFSFFSEEGHFLRTHGQAAFHLSGQMDTRLSIAEVAPLADLFERLVARIG